MPRAPCILSAACGRMPSAPTNAGEYPLPNFQNQNLSSSAGLGFGDNPSGGTVFEFLVRI
jgi:hypothetical protein